MYKTWQSILNAKIRELKGQKSQAGALSHPALEKLEQRELLDGAMRYSFGNSTLLQPGDVPITGNARYSPETGYGWQYGSVQTDAGVVLTSAGRFAVDLPNGSYQVTVTLGDPTTRRDLMAFFLENRLSGLVSTDAGKSATISRNVKLTDGQLTFDFIDLGGRNREVAIQRIDITPIGGGGGNLSARFTGSSNVNEGSAGSVNFAGVTGGSGGYKYSYDFDNDGTFEVSGSSNASVTVPASYLADGPFTRVVRGRVTDSSGAFKDYTTSITVNNVAPTATLTGPSSATVNSAVSFSGSASDPSSADAAGLSYVWDFGDGKTATGQNVSYSYAAAGNYTVKLTVSDKDGGVSVKTSSIVVSAPATPLSANFGNSGAVNEGSTGTVSFSNVTGGSGGYKYSYDFDNDGTFEVSGSSNASVTVPASYLADGPFTRVVRGRVTDSSGAFKDYTTSITVNNVAPTATLTGPSSATVNSAVSFSGSASDPSSADAAGLSYVWDFGDGKTATGQNVSYSYAAAGNYTVKLTVSDKDGGVSVKTSSIVVSAPATPLSANFGNSGAVNEGSTGTVSFSNVTGGSGGYKYSYDFDNDGTFEVSGSSNASVTVPASYLADGPFTRVVRGRVTDSSGAFKDYTTSITVNNVAPTATLTGPSSATVNSAVSFSGSASDPSSADAAGLSYVWDFGDGKTATGQNVSYSYAAAGNYTVKLTVSDKDGGVSVKTSSIAVANPPSSPLSANFRITSIPNEGSTATVAFSAVNGGSGSYKFSFDFDNDGVYEIIAGGAPSVTIPASFLDDGPGTRVVVGRLEDTAGNVKLFTASTSILNVAPTASIVGSSSGNIGALLSFSASATDPSQADTQAGFTYSWDFGDGSSASGKNVSHAYAAAGTYTVRLTVSDKDGGVTATTSTVTIVAAGQNHAPVITGLSAKTVKEGENLLIPFTVIEPDNDVLTYKVEYLVGGVVQANLPAGASFDPHTRTFRWYPRLGQAGTYSLRFRATDPYGAFAEQTIPITITQQPSAPILNVVYRTPDYGWSDIISNGDTVQVPMDFSFLITTADPQGDPVTITATGISWATMSPWGAGVSSWNSDRWVATPGMYDVVITAADPYGNQTSLNLRVEVRQEWLKYERMWVAPVLAGKTYPHYNNAGFIPYLTAKGQVDLTLFMEKPWGDMVGNANGLVYQYLLNEVPISPILTGPQVFKWDSTNYSDGVHSLTVRILDGPEELPYYRAITSIMTIDNQPGPVMGPQLIAFAGHQLHNEYDGQHITNSSLATDWVTYSGQQERATIQPYPYTYAAPVYSQPGLDLNSLNDGSKWFVESLTQARSGFQYETPSFYLTKDGQAIVKAYFPKIGITSEAAVSMVERHPYWCGGRNNNDISPYSTFVANPNGPGWFGIQLDGRIFQIYPDGWVRTHVGDVILPDSTVTPLDYTDLSISTATIIAHQETRRGIFQNNLYFNMPNDLAFDPRNSKILYVADTGNHRIAKVDFSGATPVVSTYVGLPGVAGTKDGAGSQATFNSPYSISVMNDGTIFVADRGSGKLRKIAPDGTVSTVATLANIQVIRADSKGDLIAAVPEDNGVYRITQSGTVTRIATAPWDPAAWVWLDVDRTGSIGQKDAIYVSSSRPGVGLGGDYNSNMYVIWPNGVMENWLPHSGGNLRSGVIQNQIDVFGHYPWAIAIDPDEARVITTGFGSLGVSSIRLRQASDPAPPSAAGLAAFTRGREIHERGTVGAFPTDSRPPFSAIHGPVGHSRLGNVLNFDDLALMSDAQIAAYIHSGMGGQVPRPEITGNDLRDYIYFIRMSSLQGELTGVTLGPDASDTLPPETRNVSVTQLTPNSVKITWQTDEPTLGVINYGPSNYYGLWSNIESSYSKDHEIVLSNLPGGWKFHFSITSKDVAGNVTKSPDRAHQLTGSGVGPVLAAVVVDNGQAGYAETGTWTTTGSGSGGSSRAASSQTGQNTASWTVNGLSQAVYLIQATWTASPSNATNAKYEIYDGSTLVQTVVVNQRIPPSGNVVGGVTYSTLAVRAPRSGSLRIVLSDFADGTVIADSIRVAPF